MTHEEIMKECIRVAEVGASLGSGGPFGAAVVKDGEIIAVEHNNVLRDHDPTAHAEITAIREAGSRLGTHDLSGCDLYTTCFPCPMCMCAIVWANIKNIYVGCSPADADNAGFRDRKMYDWFHHRCLTGEFELHVNSACKEECQKLFDKYKEMEGEIY